MFLSFRWEILNLSQIHLNLNRLYMNGRAYIIPFFHGNLNLYSTKRKLQQTRRIPKCHIFNALSYWFSELPLILAFRYLDLLLSYCAKFDLIYLSFGILKTTIPEWRTAERRFLAGTQPCIVVKLRIRVRFISNGDFMPWRPIL